MYARTGERVRNATCLSVAPAGTISIIAGTSGGIEPLFALAYRRAHTLGGTPLVEVNPTFLRYAATQGLDAERLTQGILTEGRLGELAGIPEVARRLFATALEVPPRPHLRIQAAFQRYVDNAVSKTINLPEESSAEDVRDAYTLAWRLGLKGITVYRYGSRGEAVLSLGAGQEPLARELFTKCDPGACATPMAPRSLDEVRTKPGASTGLTMPLSPDPRGDQCRR
jgi:ribonucleoside-diphosphate reductase alpha chain